MLCPTYISQFSLFGWLVPAGVDLFATPSQGDREGRALAVKGGKHRVGLLLQAGRHHFVEGSVIFDDKNRKHRAMYLSLVMAHNAAPPLVTRSVPRER